MSEILFGGSIATTINELVGVGGQRLWIASAFCRADSFQKWFAGKGNAFPDRRLIVRWHLGDLVAGSSDLETYSIACDNGWRFYVNKYLHAKAYFLFLVFL